MTLGDSAASGGIATIKYHTVLVALASVNTMRRQPTTMTNDHIDSLRKYYKRSRMGYNLLLGGAKHFGYHPEHCDVSERQAIRLMHDQVAHYIQLKPGQHLLDAGCGQGVVAVDLALRFNCTIDGITQVPFEVEDARHLADAKEVSDRTCFSLMDYSKTDFPNGCFDGVYSLETLSHSPDILSTLKELFRVLKPGGRVAFFEYALADEGQFTSREIRIRDAIARGSAMAALTSFRLGTLVTMLQAAGFVNVGVIDLTANTRPSLRRLRRYAMIPYLAVRLMRLQERFPNVSAAIEFYRMATRGLIRYVVIIGARPMI